ncbi:MAG TPA: tyrosine-type recombinase/integrase [Spirochaetota bacterium]|nr:tyrosine-type recombinase/integrase [Spirochaetota bacterium]
MNEAASSRFTNLLRKLECLQILNLEAFMLSYEQDFVNNIYLKGFSESTKVNYLRYLRLFMKQYEKDPYTCDIQLIKAYFVELISVKKFSSRTIYIIFSAVKFYFCNTLGNDPKQFDFYKPERSKKLPVVLKPEETAKLINTFTCIDYKMIVMLASLTGLRISEVVRVKTADINSDLHTLHVIQGKGNKDRFVPIPDDLILELRKYWKTHQNRKLLFPKRKSRNKDFNRVTTDKTISDKELQRAFKVVSDSLDFNKRVTFHTLRHTYATNLLESGVNLFMIKEYLGHSSISTTMVYLHLTNASEYYSYKKVKEYFKKIQGFNKWK